MLIPTLRLQVARWVDDEPQPGWVEAVFTDAHGETWHFFDKPSIFETSTAPALTSASTYPVSVDMPVRVVERRASPAGVIATITLPWGLDYESGSDTFDVLESALAHDERQPFPDG